MNEIVKRIVSSIILIPVVFYLIIKGSYFFNFFLFICFLITIYEWNKICKKKLYKFLGLILLLISFISAFKIRNDFFDGHLYFLLVLLICVSTDIGGYLFGKLLKGPKLTKISPNKTYAGVFGGYLLCITNIFLALKYINFESFDITLTELLIYSVLISTVSQLGDLLISYFKRMNKIKDTGNIIPGHGGILDRIDGMIFAFPFTLLLNFINLISF